MATAIDEGDYFRVPMDTRTLDYQIYFEKGKTAKAKPQSYTSHNTKQMSVDEVAKLIVSLPEYEKYLEGAIK